MSDSISREIARTPEQDAWLESAKNAACGRHGCGNLRCTPWSAQCYTTL